MFVFGSAANADDSNDGRGLGKASTSVDVATSFTFDASSLPAVTATPTANSEDATAAGGFKFNVPPSQDVAAAATEEGGAGDKNPLFGSTFQSRQEIGPGGVKTEIKHEFRSKRDVRIGVKSRKKRELRGFQGSFVSEEKLMNSGHALHEDYTCPLCCLPIALPTANHSRFKPCCMKTVCDGCFLASRQRGMADTCPFCRTPTPDNASTVLTLVRKRVDAGDPAATDLLAMAYYDGDRGLQRNIPRAIRLWTKAANYGNLSAQFMLGDMYYGGEDGFEQDGEKGIIL